MNIYEYFDKDEIAIFEKLSKIAGNNKLFLVGGAVRDFLLNRKCPDIDITFEGNAIEFAKSLSVHGVKIKSVHEDFGTIKVSIGDKNFDIASTRTEYYPKEGHLPVIKNIACPLKEDVLRRDFTVNSLALSLNTSSFGEIVDYCGGLLDLKQKVLRVLHDKSFIEDPTRILRGLKYSTRLGLSLDKHTLKLQEEYLKNVNYDMGYKRVLQEFRKIDWNAEIFKMFLEQKIYKLFQPEVLKNFDFSFNSNSYVVFLALLNLDDVEKYELTSEEKKIINRVKELKNKTFVSKFEIYKTFSKEKKETTKALAILKNEGARIYEKELSKIKVEMTGNDFIELGINPSPKFSEIFDFLIAEKIKNPALNKAGEIELVKENFLFLS